MRMRSADQNLRQASVLAREECLEPDRGLGVGTGLYIAPEVLHRKKGQNHSKVDMYSLGVSASSISSF